MIDIIIPHSNVDKFRMRNLFFIVKYYKKYLPDSNIILVEQNTESDISEIKDLINLHLKIKTKESLFSKSFLLNEGYNAGKNKYLIFGDNDCLLNKEILINFSNYFEILKNHMITPYNQHVVNLNEQQTLELIKDPNTFNYNALDLIRRACFSTGGVVIISAENYNKVGGHDPRFIGWGGEDDAFFLKTDNILGVIRLNYDLFHLNHSTGVHGSLTNPNYRNNVALYKEYQTEDNNKIINKIGFNHLLR